MNFKDTFYLAWMNIKSSKFKSIIFMLIISLFFILIACFSSGSKTISSFATQLLNKDFHHKIISINVQNNDRAQTINKLQQLDLSKITKIYSSNYDLFKSVDINDETININGNIELYGKYDGINYTLDSGRDIKNENEAVCSSNFYPGNLSGLSNQKQMFNMKEKLGIEINVTYEKIFVAKDGKVEVLNTYNLPLKMVGTFDWEKDLTGYNVCYVNGTTFDKVLNNSKTIYEDSKIEEKRFSNLGILALVDKYENMDKVMTQLTEKGFDVSPYYKLDISPLLVIEKVVNYLMLFIFISSLLIVYKFVKNTYKENEDKIKLYQRIGYKNKIVRKIFILQYILLAFISFIITLIIVPILKGIVSYIFSKNPNLSFLNIELSFIEMILYLVFVIFVIIILFNIKFSMTNRLKNRSLQNK